jgi:hypothetical protein
MASAGADLIVLVVGLAELLQRRPVEQVVPGRGGAFSIIGMPGMAAGQAWYNSAAQRGTQQGALVGYLTQGQAVGGGTNANAYVFVFGADQYVIVD